MATLLAAQERQARLAARPCRGHGHHADGRVAGPRPGADGERDVGRRRRPERASGRVERSGRLGPDLAGDEARQRSPSRWASAPPVPTSSVASVQPSSASARPDRLAPGRLAGRPDVVGELVADDLGRPHRRARRRSGRPSRGPRSGRRPRPAGRTSRRSGSSSAGTPRRGCPRRRTRRSRPGGRSTWATSAPRPRDRRRGSTQSCHIGRISRGGPGSATMTRPSGRSTHQPGAVPFAVRDRRRRRDAPGLLEVDRREGHAPPVPQPWSQASRAGIDHRDLVARRRDGLPGQVVRRGPEAAGRNDEIGALESVPERLRDRVEIVGECLEPSHPDARLGERARQLAGVRVAGLTDGQLGADREQLSGAQRAGGGTGHDRSVAQGRRYLQAPVRGTKAPLSRGAVRRRVSIDRPVGGTGPPDVRRATMDRRWQSSVPPASPSSIGSWPSSGGRASSSMRSPRTARCRPVGPTSWPTRHYPISRASRTASGAGCGPMPPAWRRCTTS